MSSNRNVSRPTLALWVTAALGAGIIIGWLVTGNLGADWVGAVGTWIGSLGTVGAIAWAIHTFREENEEKVRARIESERAQRDREQALAEGVRVACRGGTGRGNTGRMEMTSVHVDLANETPVPVGIVEFSLPGVVVKPEPHWPPTLADGSNTTKEIRTEKFACPDDEFSGRPLTSFTPTIVYRIDGVTWKRTGGETPTRVTTDAGNSN